MTSAAKKTMLVLRPKRSAAPHGWLFWFALAVLVAAGAASAVALYWNAYEDRIFPGVRIGALEVGGLSQEEALRAVTRRIDAILEEGFLLFLGDKTAQISPWIIAPDDPDLNREVVQLDKQKAVEQALSVGRRTNFLFNAIEQLKSRFSGIVVSVPISVRSEDWQALIADAFPGTIVPAQNAAMEIIWEEGEAHIRAVPEQAGRGPDIEQAEAEIIRSLTLLEHPSLTLRDLTEEPSVKIKDVDSVIPQAGNLLKQGPWVLNLKNRNWKIAPERFGRILTVQKDDRGEPYLAVGGAELEFLFNEIAAAVNQSPRDAKFKLQGGKVVEFQGSREGMALDRASTASKINEYFIAQGATQTEIATTITPPKIKTAEVNDLGIETLLGSGISNFRGSPPNRVKNIKNGARLLNGTLVPPGQTFSLLATLQPFTADNGYLPELVIKGDKINPEIGGGLCQLGTTTFRATMNSGLPVTARRNHSLVVSYYNDPSNGNPGTDATIYDPAPDFKFLNDTGAHILITTEVDEPNSELRFLFWGRPDGRKGYYSPPVVDRWFPAGETKYIETMDLPPGKEQCQSAHTGADAHFTYTIEGPDGAVEERVFESHYRALPKICLVGVEKPTEDPAPNITENLTPTEAADL